MVVRARSWQYSSGPLQDGLPSGSRNISLPASSRAATRGFPPVAASRATIPTGAPPLMNSVSSFSRMFPWTPKLSFGSLRSERVRLPPAEFSRGDIHRRGHGAVGGGASGGGVGDPVVAHNHPAAQRPRRHEPIHDVDEPRFGRQLDASQHAPVGRVYAVQNAVARAEDDPSVPIGRRVQHRGVR